MSIDIVKELEKDFPNFAKIFLGTKKVTKMISELEKIAQENNPCNNNNIFSRIEKILRNPKTQKGPKGLPYFATSIFWHILCLGTMGQVLSEKTILYHEQKLGELIHRYGDKKTKRVLTTLYHGSDRFDMLAHEFYTFHFGSAYNCEFEKSFPEADDNPSFDIYIKELDLAIEVKAANRLNEAFTKFPALVTKKFPKSPQGIMQLDEAFEKCGLGDINPSSSIVDCPKDELKSAFLEAVDHTYKKQGDFDGKMLCAFSLPRECIDQLFSLMHKMNRKGELDRKLYYLFHDPEGYLGSSINETCGTTFDSSTVYFVQFAENDDILSKINCAFCDYEGKFEYVPAYYYTQQHLRGM